MKDTDHTSEPWKNDSLGYAAIGETFTNVIKSIDDSKVISIEAGFGHGKTFFRHAWAQQLRATGELVIEIDAQQSDHSGDPIITFMGALLKAQPASGKPLSKGLKDKSLKLAGVAGRAVVRAALRSGADEVLGAVSDWVQDKAPDISGLDKAVEDLEASLSKAAAQMIATHLAAETARIDELPVQIDKLRDALTDGAKSDRIIILIDELDRCHPEYAISLLEAMKLVFGRKGFVFCLMVNPLYLEGIAKHRFGHQDIEELYLEKFVDLRLALKPTPERQGYATAELVRRINVGIPFGTDACFSTEAAAELSDRIVQRTKFSFRQIKRTIERVELAARCYRDTPIDLPLLTLLAFSDNISSQAEIKRISSALLPRSNLTPDAASKLISGLNKPPEERRFDRAGQAQSECEAFIKDFCSDLVNLDTDRYDLPPPEGDKKYYDWYKVLAGLGPTYIPSHRAMLEGVLRIMA